METHKKKYLLLGLLFGATQLLSGCYMYNTQAEAKVEGIDIDETLAIAQMELEDNKFSSVLTLWAIRDQHFTAEQAYRVSHLYFQYIHRIDSEEQKAQGFSVWHLTWAISNMYRFGDESVQRALRLAYVDAAGRVEKLDMKVATTHFQGEKMYTGDAHAGGRSYAKKHLVVPGNDKYLQSVEEYLDDRD